jgi:hypothetical protein
MAATDVMDYRSKALVFLLAISIEGQPSAVVVGKAPRFHARVLRSDLRRRVLLGGFSNGEQRRLAKHGIQ